METVYIYGLFDPRNYQLRYIGKSNNPEKRLYRHIMYAKSNDRNHHIYNWIRQLLSENLEPSLEILEECNKQNWRDIERAWIKEAIEKGVDLTNETSGGDGLQDYIFSEEQRKRMSESRKGRVLNEKTRFAIIQSNKIRVTSEETRLKMSKTRKGRPSPIRGIKRSEETKQKIREKKLGKNPFSAEAIEKMSRDRSGEKNVMYGKTHTEEAREKIRQAQIGRKHTDEHRLKNSIGVKLSWEKRRLK